MHMILFYLLELYNSEKGSLKITTFAFECMDEKSPKDEHNTNVHHQKL
jgi:hypothetical protein